MKGSTQPFCSNMPAPRSPHGGREFDLACSKIKKGDVL